MHSADRARHACTPSACAGYKEKPRTSTTYDRAEIVECGKGEVAYWNWGVNPATRVPSNPELCQACAGGNKYAPRTGALAGRAAGGAAGWPGRLGELRLAGARHALAPTVADRPPPRHRLLRRHEHLPALPCWAGAHEEQRRPAWIRFLRAVLRQLIPARHRGQVRQRRAQAGCKL